MRITFWGVRGSIPTPGPDTVDVGGNTSCVEVRAGKLLLIFDGGTGLRLLGKTLLKEMPITAHLFFSHVHWDHIQGFPFFDPAFVARQRHPPLRRQQRVAHARGDARRADGPSELPGPPHGHGREDDTSTTSSRASAARARRRRRHEGVVTLGARQPPERRWAYRVDHGGHSVVYATDTEHYAVVDPRLVALAKDVDVLIYDSQYTPEEYAGTAGVRRLQGGLGTQHLRARRRSSRRPPARRSSSSTTTIRCRATPRWPRKERRARELFPNCEAAREGLKIDV